MTCTAMPADAKSSQVLALQNHRAERYTKIYSDAEKAWCVLSTKGLPPREPAEKKEDRCLRGWVDYFFVGLVFL